MVRMWRRMACNINIVIIIINHKIIRMPLYQSLFIESEYTRTTIEFSLAQSLSERNQFDRERFTCNFWCLIQTSSHRMMHCLRDFTWLRRHVARTYYVKRRTNRLEGAHRSIVWQKRSRLHDRNIEKTASPAEKHSWWTSMSGIVAMRHLKRIINE